MGAPQNFFQALTSPVALGLNHQFGRGYPFLQDWDFTWDIIMFIPTKYIDTRDPAISKDGFIGYYYDKKRIRYDTALFGNSVNATITAWEAYFDGLGDNHMTLYHNWVAIGRRAITTVPLILVNDAKLFRRVYNQNPVPGTTDLYLDFGNTIRRTIITVAGDQTIAGGYYY